MCCNPIVYDVEGEFTNYEETCLIAEQCYSMCTLPSNNNCRFAYQCDANYGYLLYDTDYQPSCNQPCGCPVELRTLPLTFPLGGQELYDKPPSQQYGVSTTIC